MRANKRTLQIWIYFLGAMILERINSSTRRIKEILKAKEREGGMGHTIPFKGMALMT
jgi:hypothetical protein